VNLLGFIRRFTGRNHIRNENINQIKSETMMITGHNASTVKGISNNPLSPSIIILHNIETRADGKKPAEVLRTAC
jgi:hypothetical protein